MKNREKEDGYAHAIDGACYSLTAEYRKHVPTLTCTCGKVFSDLTWEEAGAAYDEHLDEESD